MNYKRALFYCIELIVVSAVFFADYYFLNQFHHFYTWNFFKSSLVVERLREFPLYLKAFWIALGVWAIALRLRSPYSQLRIQTNFMILQHVVLEGFLFTVLYASVAFLFKFDFLGRLFILFYAATSVIATRLTA